jgi:hypothetical protein
MAHERKIRAGLDGALARAPVRTLDLDDARWIVFSDHHKGKRDGADDFQAAEKAYHAALGYYLEAGYTLAVLGDVEELWECRPRDVLRAYPRTFALERAFLDAGRYLRFWGNHDDEWASPSAVRRHLAPVYGPGLEVWEALRCEVQHRGRRLGTLFLVHGHQGTLWSDRWRPVSRVVVRHVWRPIQRWTRIPTTTPARDPVLRERHDVAMYRWAAARTGLVLVAGHTHRPVFVPEPRAAAVEAELDRVRASLAALGAEAAEVAALRERAALLRAELEWVRVLEALPAMPETPRAPPRPCYFNTGCCCYPDGDVTGIEIADGELRLVRWPDDEGRPRPKVLRRASLAQVLAACAA